VVLGAALVAMADRGDGEADQRGFDPKSRPKTVWVRSAVMSNGAIFHVQVSTVSRSRGRSSVAASAYRAATKLLDKRTGLVHDYQKRRG
jgi:hypothetical protein